MSDHGFGDPAGMRALAARLRIKARSLEKMAHDVAYGVNRMEFDGPAATQYRIHAVRNQRRLDTAGGTLRVLAAELDQTAAEAQRQIAEARRREEERRRAEADAKRKASQRR